MANETLFPTRVDFGRVALGQEVVRRHTLECKVIVERKAGGDGRPC
jgi:hypothetical protein